MVLKDVFRQKCNLLKRLGEIQKEQKVKFSTFMDKLEKDLQKELKRSLFIKNYFGATKRNVSRSWIGIKIQNSFMLVQLKVRRTIR